MGGLFGALELGRQSLAAQQYALQITSHNIANVNTPGYSRQLATFEDTYIVQAGVGSVGMGVRVNNVETFRNRFLQLRINQETQNLGALDTRTQGLEQIESILAPSGGGIRERIEAFFGSLQTLSADPTNRALRTEVMTRGSELSSAFRQSYNQLQTFQEALDTTVSSTVSEINSLTQRIAALNQQMYEGLGSQGQVSDIRDQRDELLKQLAGDIGINYYEDDKGGLTIHTESGSLLVIGNESQDITTGPSGTDPFTHAYVNGTDITDTVTGGKLGGTFQLRDNDIPSYLTELDNLAGTIITNVNIAHSAGYDLNDNTGINFFQPFTQPAPGDNTGAARNMSVAVTNADSIAAASTPGTPGDNSNILSMLNLENNTYTDLGDKSFSSAMQSSLTRIGVDLQSARSDVEYRQTVLSNLQNSRDAVSGVSLDEEAVNLVEYQRAFEAMSRFMRTMDQLTGDLIQTLGG